MGDPSSRAYDCLREAAGDDREADTAYSNPMAGLSMRIIWRNERFEMEGEDTYAAREILKQHGFWWDREKKAWYLVAGARLSGLRGLLQCTISSEAYKHYQEAASIAQKAIEASRATDAEIKIPCPPGCEFLPFQRAGIAYAINHKDTLFGDEMGLGKSIEAVGVVNADPCARTILIICPATLKLNWRNEWMKWDIKGLEVEIIKPDTKKFPDTSVVILNYELLPKWQKELRQHEWSVMIVDEVHYVKNPSTTRAQEIFGRKRAVNKEKPDGSIIKCEQLDPIPAKRRLFLTGTPILNRPIELWPIIKALAPKFEKDKRAFGMKYCAAHHNGFGWDFKGASNLDDLQLRLRALFMVRRLKKDVLKELPSKRRQVLVLESKGLDEILEKEKQTYEQYKEALAETNFETPAFAEMSKIRKQVAIAKIPFVINHVENILEETSKIIIFCHHREVATQLAERLDATLQRLNRKETRQMDNFKTRIKFTCRSSSMGVPMSVRQNPDSGSIKQNDGVHEMSPSKTRTSQNTDVSAMDQCSGTFSKERNGIHDSTPGHHDSQVLSITGNTSEGRRKNTPSESITRQTGSNERVYSRQHLGDQLASELDEEQHHKRTTTAICKKFASVVVITGETKNEDRQEAVDRFQNDPNCRVFVGSIKAAGVGLTLTASSTVIFAELDWVPGNVSQCEDRAHRIGQVDSVLIQHLVLEGSLDERMAQLIIQKQEVIDKALDEPEGKSASI